MGKVYFIIKNVGAEGDNEDEEDEDEVDEARKPAGRRGGEPAAQLDEQPEPG